MEKREYFAMNFETRKAVFVKADSYYDARCVANDIIGPEIRANQIGVCTRASKAFDRFTEMTTNIIFDVPKR